MSRTISGSGLCCSAAVGARIRTSEKKTWTSELRNVEIQTLRSGFPSSAYSSRLTNPGTLISDSCSTQGNLQQPANVNAWLAVQPKSKFPILGDLELQETFDPAYGSPMITKALRKRLLASQQEHKVQSDLAVPVNPNKTKTCT